MGRFRRLLEWLQTFDEAKWPNGVSWPEGSPTERPDYRWKIAATVVLPIIVGAILIVSGLPVGLTVVVFILVVTSVAVYVIRETIREAKRQGWGSNLGW